MECTTYSMYGKRGLKRATRIMILNTVSKYTWRSFIPCRKVTLFSDDFSNLERATMKLNYWQPSPILMVVLLVPHLASSGYNVCAYEYEWSHWSGRAVDVCVVTRTDHTDYWPDPDSGPSLPGCAAQSEGLTFLQGTKNAFLSLFHSH